MICVKEKIGLKSAKKKRSISIWTIIISLSISWFLIRFTESDVAMLGMVVATLMVYLYYYFTIKVDYLLKISKDYDACNDSKSLLSFMERYPRLCKSPEVSEALFAEIYLYNNLDDASKNLKKEQKNN